MVIRRKEIIKIRAEIKETKETTTKINKTKSWFFKKINRQTVSQTRKEKREKKKHKI